MSKQRHIKTIVEKYGFGDVMKQANEILNSKTRGEEEFNKLPYIGIAYVDWDDRKASSDLIYYFEDFSIEGTGLIKLKLLEINPTEFTVAQYNDHHHDICIIKAKHNNYIMDGNVIKSKKDY
jgi:hypothetical protein